MSIVLMRTSLMHDLGTARRAITETGTRLRI